MTDTKPTQPTNEHMYRARQYLATVRSFIVPIYPLAADADADAAAYAADAADDAADARAKMRKACCDEIRRIIPMPELTLRRVEKKRVA